jgi:hypothetical protein
MRSFEMGMIKQLRRKHARREVAKARNVINIATKELSRRIDLMEHNAIPYEQDLIKQWRAAIHRNDEDAMLAMLDDIRMMLQKRET